MGRYEDRYVDKIHRYVDTYIGEYVVCVNKDE